MLTIPHESYCAQCGDSTKTLIRIVDGKLLITSFPCDRCFNENIKEDKIVENHNGRLCPFYINGEKFYLLEMIASPLGDK